MNYHETITFSVQFCLHFLSSSSSSKTWFCVRKHEVNYSNISISSVLEQLFLLWISIFTSECLVFLNILIYSKAFIGKKNWSGDVLGSFNFVVHNENHICTIYNTAPWIQVRFICFWHSFLAHTYLHSTCTIFVYCHSPIVPYKFHA